MIPNNTRASEYRVRTLDRNDLDEKGKIYIGQGGTTTINTTPTNKVEGVSNIEAKNIIEAINDNSADKDISAGSFTASGKIQSKELHVTAGGEKKVDIYGDTGNIQSNGTITAQEFDARSDKRLKENIVEYLPNKSILDLPIYSYNFISDEKKTKKIGCLAQDLQKICPEIVREDDKGFLSIEENKLVYLLLEEVKKLKKRVDELEVRNGD